MEQKIPTSWKLLPLKRVAVINPEVLPEDTDPDFEILYVDIGSVSLEDGIREAQSLRFEDAPSRARRRVKAGDTIVSTVRTYLRAIAPVNNPPDNMVVSTGFAVVRSMGDINQEFLSWVLRSSQFVDAVVADSVGVSYPAIAPTALGSIYILVAPESLQRPIASFLDNETAKIDRLITKQKEFLARLDEHRAALITEVISQGVHQLPKIMSDGEAQAKNGWKFFRVKHLVIGGNAGIQIGPFGTSLKDLPESDTGYGLYGQQNTISNDFATCYRWVSPDFYRGAPQYRMVPGDLVVTRKGSIGNCRVVPEDISPGCFDSDTIRIRLNENIVLVRFVEKVLHEAPYIRAQLGETKRGAVLSGLNSEVIANLRIIVPPLKEQITILNFLDQASHRIERIRTGAIELIDRLKKRRAALITAAVTGQIDVNKAVPREVAA